VLAVDEHLVGGECPYYGCIPTKMMLHESRRPVPDWSRVAGRIRREATDDWDDRAAVERLQVSGARFLRGHAEVDGGPTAAPGPDGTVVTITPGDGGLPQRWTARRAVVLNTGSEPVAVDVPGLPESVAWTHREVVTARTLPGRLAVVGGGPLGCELAQALAGFGVRVSMLVRGERLLSGEDPAAGELLAEAFRAAGIDVRTSTQAREVRPARDEADHDEGGPGPVVLTLSTGEVLEVDRVLLATGRRPRDPVDVDEYCRVLAPGARAGGGTSGRASGRGSGRGSAETGQPVVGRYAIGDMTGVGPFTHTSMAQAALVAHRYPGSPIRALRWPPSGGPGPMRGTPTRTGRSGWAGRTWPRAPGAGSMRWPAASHSWRAGPGLPMPGSWWGPPWWDHTPER
jgi:pyruvate/2-oxoglutarate dehydrogenase complex dihydrolipoamide dehydrogenase (E3) component